MVRGRVVSGNLRSSPLPSVRRDAAPELLGKQVTGSSTVGVCGGLQRGAQRPEQRRLHVLAELELQGKIRSCWVIYSLYSC